MDKLEFVTQKLLLNAQLNALLKAQIEIDDVFFQQKEEIERQIRELEQNDD